MAAIPDANVTNRTHGQCGPIKVWIAKVKGDGSGTTFKVPFARVMGTAVGNIDETAGYNPQISASGNTLTYGAAPTNNLYHWLYVFGV